MEWRESEPTEPDPPEPEAERVRPLGVFDHPGDDGSSLPLRVTVHEMLEHLRLTATFGDDRDAAKHLATHVRDYAQPDLCKHGLPLWHDGRSSRFSCALPQPRSGVTGVRVADVRAMITTIDALSDCLHHLTTQRRRLPRRISQDLLAWPLLGHDMARLVAAEIQRDGGLQVFRARQLLCLIPTKAMHAAGLRTEVVWRAQRRPELALDAMTSVAVYLADVIQTLGLVSEERSLLCSVCGQPFTPKRPPRPGDGIYCRGANCQRERAKRKQAAYRTNHKES